jgi:NDP-sugar pyrophosphorylase family protein
MNARPELSNAVHVVLQAGGKGERIGAQSCGVPKCLLSVAGMPMLERLLRQFLASGARRFTIITGAMADRVESFLDQLAFLDSGVHLSVLCETAPRGNAGSLDSIDHQGRSVVLCFADLVTDLDFARLSALHRESGAAITLASHYEDHQIQLGELTVDREHVTGYREKPRHRFLICSGIGIFEPHVLRLIPADRPTGLADLVTLALAHGFPVNHWTHGAFWMDINTQAALEAANHHFAAKGDALISSAVISPKITDSHLESRR